jgi:hypothetical protein
MGKSKPRILRQLPQDDLQSADMNFSESAASGARPLRILEIGGAEFCVVAAPWQTEFYWTGIKPRGRVHRAFGPARLIRSLIKLRRREFDLLVVHTTLYAPWHPRSILTALRDWHFRAPLGLFAMFAWRFVHLFHDVPIAVVDLDDSCQIGRHNFFLLDRCGAFFKRELPSDHWLAFCGGWYPKFPGRNWRSKRRNQRRVEKLKPISLGVAPQFRDEVAPPREKKSDIFFVGAVTDNSTVRITGMQELQALAREGYVIDMPAERLARPEFLERIGAAWLAWSPGGLGWDCTRHYEAPLAGAVPLINDPTILRHQPLRDGEHCVFYHIEPGGLAEAARRALADKPRLRRMAQVAAEHVRVHHSLHARAEYVTVTVLGRRLDGSRVDPGEPSSDAPALAPVQPVSNAV